MSKRLYIGNLPFVVEAHQLQALFAAKGRRVESVKIIMDRSTGRSRGFAFIEMGTDRDAEGAMRELNGHELLGRAISVTEARGEPQPSSTSPDEYPEDGLDPEMRARIARAVQRRSRQ